MKPQKRKRSSKYRDRLSEMPDEVIVHILSYLPIVDAVRTMLIRPFGNLWTLLPTLKFEADQVINKMIPGDNYRTSNHVGRFYIFVRNVLMLHKRPIIDKFYLYLGFNYDDGRMEASDEVKMWLRFALDKQAKEIYFCDVSYDYSQNSDFPNFTSQSLVTLELCNCSIDSQLQVNLGSLKKLILCEVYMCEEALRQFICGCPSLQEVRIVEPCYIKNLSFSAPNIRNLSLVLIEEEKSDDPWSLDFPNLRSLDLEINRIPDVIDVSSVRDIFLKSWVYFVKDDENEIRMFKLFLVKFSCSEVFQLSRNASEPFLHSIDDSHRLEIRWKRLVLHLCIFCQSCLSSIYQLMRSSIHLEELIIYTDTSLTRTSVCNTPSLFSGQAFKDKADLPPVELSNPFVMPKLKTVTLHGYGKLWKPLLHLVEFLLRSATVLEKLVIVPNKNQLTVGEKLDKLDFVMHVSSLQRSSPSARVLFL